jgi:hypothetical protein
MKVNMIWEFGSHPVKISRTYTCPMWYRVDCESKIRIQDGPVGLLDVSHAGPDNSGLVTRFIYEKRLIPKHEIPEAVKIL